MTDSPLRRLHQSANCRCFVQGITEGIPPENVRVIKDAVILDVSIDFDPNAFGGTITLVPDRDMCVCSGVQDDPCLGVPGESDACDACLRLDPEAPCLREPAEVSP